MASEEYNRMNQDRAGLQRPNINQFDIDSMASGWLTETCIREIIGRFGNFTSSRVNIVDPLWFSAWIQEGGPTPATTPVFFKPRPGITAVTGLAIPFNEGNKDWSALYVDLEHCGAVYFNTMPDADDTRNQHARKVMLHFYDKFREFFEGKGLKRFRLEVDDKCAKQGDGASCGIYAAAAVIDLLAMARPRTERLSDEQIKNFRKNGVKWLSEAPKSWDWLQRDGPSKPQPKKGAHWDPSIR